MMMKHLTATGAHIAGLFSVLSLFLSGLLNVPEPWRAVCLIALSSLFVLGATWEWWTYFSKRPKRYKRPKDINKYMCRWVSQPGQVVVFSRDLTWAAGAQTQKVLIEKAKNNELKILMESENSVSAALKEAGAQIITYKKFGHTPKARFTIVGVGRDGARLAIGVPVAGVHTIEEFEAGDHPLFSVAEDLVSFLSK